MTNQEAKGRLEFVLSTCENKNTSYATALKVAIEALQYNHTVRCSGCLNFDIEHMSAVCHECARAYRDRYEG